MPTTIVDNLDKTMDEEYYSYIKEWFRRESKFYHFLVDIPSSRIRDKIVHFTNAREGSRILDVATGTGGQAFAFAKKDYDVVGIDLSEVMIEVAKKLNWKTLEGSDDEQPGRKEVRTSIC